MFPKFTVSAVIPNSEGKYLYVLNEKDGLWSLLAGKVKEKESPLEALARESFEEIKAGIQIHSLIRIYQFVSIPGNEILNFTYFATLRNQNIHPGEGIKEVKYFTIEEVQRLLRENKLRSKRANLQPLLDYQTGLRFPKEIVYLLLQ